MSVLIAGLVLFFASHSVGLAAPDFRARQVARMGIGPWKLAYSAVSLIALILIIWGYGIARQDPVVLWSAPAWTRHAAALLSVIGFVLIAAAYVPGTNMKAALGHPMTVGTGVWALGHLLANGRLNAVLLFGAFVAWAVIAYATRRARDRAAGTRYPPGSLGKDAIAAVAGVVFALVFALFLHGPLIGLRPFG
ncbi:MAG TPA: NnrU family protein [Casimicrobiaceae bacterium]|nr:NnrU family protein [Casimicrobiaceae bacterium]